MFQQVNETIQLYCMFFQISDVHFDTNILEFRRVLQCNSLTYIGFSLHIYILHVVNFKMILFTFKCDSPEKHNFDNRK